jgi:hypothetical protein
MEGRGSVPLPEHEREENRRHREDPYRPKPGDVGRDRAHQRRVWTAKARPLSFRNPLGCLVRRERGGGGIMAKGQEKPKKTNKPKLTTAEKQKKKKEKSTTSK